MNITLLVVLVVLRCISLKNDRERCLSRGDQKDDVTATVLQRVLDHHVRRTRSRRWRFDNSVHYN